MMLNASIAQTEDDAKVKSITKHAMISCNNSKRHIAAQHGTLTLPADGQPSGALSSITAGASSFSLLYSAILSTALKAFSATLANLTVMEVREVI